MHVKCVFPHSEQCFGKSSLKAKRCNINEYSNYINSSIITRLFHIKRFNSECFQEEDEVPDDETVNQMIARSEEEFDQFMVSF